MKVEGVGVVGGGGVKEFPIREGESGDGPALGGVIRRGEPPLEKVDGEKRKVLCLLRRGLKEERYCSCWRRKGGDTGKRGGNERGQGEKVLQRREKKEKQIETGESEGKVFAQRTIIPFKACSGGGTRREGTSAEVKTLKIWSAQIKFPAPEEKNRRGSEGEREGTHTVRRGETTQFWAKSVASDSVCRFHCYEGSLPLRPLPSLLFNETILEHSLSG